MRLFLLVGLFSLSTSFSGLAQQKPLPSWVAMMEDPKVNYYEALEAFNTFWKNIPKPVEAMELDEEAEKERILLTAYLKTLNTAERNYYDQLAYHFKRFKKWRQENRAFVQEDGSILTEEERMAIWYQQQEEIKNQRK